MYRYLLWVIITVAFNCYKADGQTTQIVVDDGYNITNIPQEQVFLHYNTSLLFVGEYLYYSIYCLNREDKKYSGISKIAYVELVGENGKAIFRHKIRLDQGVGQGDFFIPVSVPSGNYKIIGYTQWMMNEGKRLFFQGDISIINPYQSDQSKILASEENSDDEKIVSAVVGSPLDISKTKETKIVLTTAKRTYHKREKVSIVLKNTNVLSQGRYSISIRAIDTIDIAPRYTARTFGKEYAIHKLTNDNEELFLPEIRGELISGRIISKKSGLSVMDKNVALSIPDKEGILKIATTNRNGRFYMNLDKEYDQRTAFVQVLDEKENYTISLDKHISAHYDYLRYHSFRITPEMKTMIEERSIYNQINTIFFPVKPDTLALIKPISTFYGSKGKVYLLDDFTRFPTVKETILEIIDHVWLRKTGEDTYNFLVRRSGDAYQPEGLLPLLIVDGVFIQDHNLLVDYDSRKIKAIKVVRDKYYLGPKVFQGIIDIETMDGDYHKTLNESYIHAIKLFSPLHKKKYFKQNYQDATQEYTDHMPDYRRQLLWMPDFVMKGAEKHIDFFTSDIVGDYEICLEGFTKKGDPVSIREVITVQDMNLKF